MSSSAFDKANDIPWLSPEKIQSLDSYINSTKCLEQKEFVLWRLYKKSMAVLWGNFEKGIFDMESEKMPWASLALLAETPTPSLKALLIIES